MSRNSSSMKCRVESRVTLAMPKHYGRYFRARCICGHRHSHSKECGPISRQSVGLCADKGCQFDAKTFSNPEAGRSVWETMSTSNRFQREPTPAHPFWPLAPFRPVATKTLAQPACLLNVQAFIQGRLANLRVARARPGPSYSAGCTRNQPWRHHLGPF